MIRELAEPLWVKIKSLPVPTTSFASSTNSNALSDLSKRTEVIPETPWNSTSSLNVAVSATFKTSKSVWPSTSKLPLASIVLPNVATPTKLVVLVKLVCPVNVDIPEFLTQKLALICASSEVITALEFSCAAFPM